jgi:FlaA1/EpsC-like NDP-sugar epimerase
MWLVGVYEKNTKWLKLLVGLSLGTIMIATVYAFFPNYLRTSRGVIVGAFLLHLFLLIIYRLILFSANGTLHSFIKDVRKYIIIASENEAAIIATQLEKSSVKRKYIGFISLNNGIQHPKNLGAIENMNDIIDAYHPNELLFSTEEVSTQFIIETMSKIKEPIAFRLVTKNNTIISSTSKNKSGEIYSFDINLTSKKSWIDKMRSWI